MNITSDLAFPELSQDDPSMPKKIVAAVDKLMEEGPIELAQQELSLALTFFERFVLLCFYKRSEIIEWMAKNKNESLFRIITMVSVAYCRMVFDSNELLWDDQSKLSAEERKNTIESIR